MPSFKGNDSIVLQPTTSGIGYGFDFPIKASTSAVAGFLPYNTTISSSVVTASKSDGTDTTNDMIISNSETEDNVNVILQYPATNGEGTYYLKFVLTLNDGSTVEADFNRIIARDL